MKKTHTYKIGTDVMLEGQDSEVYTNSKAQKGESVIVRYLAAGVMEKGRFSGLILDYDGGGSYGDHVVLNGREVCSIEDDGEETYDTDALQAHLDSFYPGLVKACNKAIAKIVAGYDDSYIPLARACAAAEFARLARKRGESTILSKGPRLGERPSVGNTIITLREV